MTAIIEALDVYTRSIGDPPYDLLPPVDGTAPAHVLTVSAMSGRGSP